jgi:hypothetical protein
MKALSCCIRENASARPATGDVLLRIEVSDRGVRYAGITATQTPGPTPVAAWPGEGIDPAGLLGQ